MTLDISPSSSVLVTGAAGFIGMHVAQRLLEKGARVVGVDNFDPYYDIQLKKDRLTVLLKYPLFEFHEVDIADQAGMAKVFDLYKDTYPILNVVQLAAQAGVRYSLDHPYLYVHSNIEGFLVVLEMCRHQPGFQHLVYASSSSVYGAIKDLPFSPTQVTNTPLSLYAATKAAGELMAYSYTHLYKFKTTGLRFFTVYGPWGRPDMGVFKFVQDIYQGKTIDVYNNGQMKRDFTYVNDIATGVIGALCRKNPDLYKIYNLGNHKAEPLERYIGCIEKALGKKAIKRMLPLQAGDVPETFADIEESIKDLGFSPKTTIDEGVPRFVDWFKKYYHLS